MAKSTVLAVTPADIVRAAVKVWGIGLQGLQVRTIVRTTDRVPRLQGEPAEGNRHHVYTGAEATMVVDGLTARSSMAHLDADKVLTALGVPVTVRQDARRAYAKRRGQAVPASTPKGRAQATPKGDPLGRRAVRTPAPAAAPAPTTDA